jgi:hypothetical protein
MAAIANEELKNVIDQVKKLSQAQQHAFLFIALGGMKAQFQTNTVNKKEVLKTFHMALELAGS